MNFAIQSAVIKTIPAGRQGAGEKYVEITMAEDSMFAEREHKQCLFVPARLIPAWEKAIAENNFPAVKGKYVIVEGLPPHYHKKQDGTIIPVVHTSMRLFVRVDDFGVPVEDPRGIALRVIIARMEPAEMGTVDSEPV